MISVYIKGAGNAIDVTEWIKHNLSNCWYELKFNYNSPFSDIYKFEFKSKSDATMVALKWGNEYGRLEHNSAT
jgi:hypothetical protein